MTPFEAMATQQWRCQVDEYDLNEPTICYRDPTRPTVFVGPLATVPIGATEEDEEGETVLDIGGPDGMNLAAIMCLPQFAGLCEWIQNELSTLGPSKCDESGEDKYGAFVAGLRDRVGWIVSCINKRDETMTVGLHGFESYRKRPTED